MAKTKEPKEPKAPKAPKEKKTVGIEKPKKAKASKVVGDAAASGDASEKKTRGPLTRQQIERRNRFKRSRGLRSKAVEAGFLKRAEGGDILSSLITKGEIKKMLQFVPVRVGRKEDGVKGGFDKNEHEERNETALARFGTDAITLLQAKAESLFRGVMTEAAQRALEFGKTTIDTTVMASVLRPYAAKTYFETLTPPEGVINHAFDVGIMKPTEADEAEAEESKKTAKALQTSIDHQLKEQKELRETRAAAFKAKGAKRQAA